MYLNVNYLNAHSVRAPATRPATKKTRVLFVCMANICRSPLAEGVFRKIVKDHNVGENFIIDSAGTHTSRVGEAPDVRSQNVAKAIGVQLDHLRSRKIHRDDFEKFDFIMAMDTKNYNNLLLLCPQPYRSKVKYFLDYAPQLNTREVPDPYFGGKSGFQTVLNLVDVAAKEFFSYTQQVNRGH